MVLLGVIKSRNAVICRVVRGKPPFWRVLAW